MSRNSHRFFISTFCCIDLPLNRALAALSDRTTSVEIMSDGLHNLLDDATACAEHPFTYSVHSPSSEINIAAIGERIRVASLDVLEDHLRVCTKIDASHMVVHPGITSYDQVRSRSYHSLLRSLDQLECLQEEYGVRICIENMGGWECCHFRSPDLVPELVSRDLGFAFDCGHAQLNNNLDTFLSQKNLVHVHLHDNNGLNDEHSACGDGTINFPYVLQRLPEDAELVIETRDLTTVDRSIVYLERLGQGVIS